MKKKVIHVIRNIGNGGTEKYMFNIISNTMDSYENVIISYGPITHYKDYISKNEIKLIELYSPKKNFFAHFREIISIFKREKPNIVYSYTYYNSSEVMFAAFLCNVKKRITHSHRSSSEQKKSIIYILYIMISKILISLFSTNCLSCGKVAGKSLFYRKFKIINNSIDIKKYLYNPDLRDEIRKKYSINKSTIVIGTIGRIDENKNQSFLIDLITKMKDYNVCLFIVGDGPELPRLKNKVQELKLNSKVYLIGNVNDAEKYYNMFDVFALPSIKEGLPYVLIEAQTNGLNCIVSDTIDEECNLTGTVLFKDLNDTDSWIRSLINTTKERNKNISNIVDNFSNEKVSSEIKNIYEQ